MAPYFLSSCFHLKNLHTRLHAAAYFLICIKADEEICCSYHDVIERLVPLRSERRLIDVLFDKFKRSKGFGRELAVDARTIK